MAFATRPRAPPDECCYEMSDKQRDRSEEPPILSVTRLAGRQFGLIHRDQAIALGMTSSAISYRLGLGWESLHRGVYLLPGFDRSWEQRVLAACMRGGQSCVASHSTAAALHRLDGCRQTEPIHLYAPTGWRAPGVKVHRTRSLPACDVISFGAVPTTECSRTLLDLGAVADEEAVEIALECALHRGLTSVPRLRWRLQQVGGRGHPGTALLRRLLDLREGHGRPAQSVLEVKFIRALRQAGLPHPQRQFSVETQHCGRFIDFAFPTLLLGIEVGGRRAHSGPAAEQRDSRRHNELTRLGWRLLYFTWDDVDHRLDYVITCIEEELRPRLV